MLSKLLRNLLLLSLLVPASAGAENARQFDDYTIHYNALNTDFLQPAVATAYQIRRSKNRGMINISVKRKQPDGKLISVPANVRCEAYNLSNQQRTLTFREIDEGNAIYYISDFAVANRETLDFKLHVKPHDREKTYEFSFRKQFFSD